MSVVQSLSTPFRHRLNAIMTRWHRLIETARDPCRPEHHYIRGPGPKRLAKHPGLYGDVVVKGVIDSGHGVSARVGVERAAFVMVLSSQWLSAAPGAAAVKAGRRPPPEAARSGLDRGKDGAKLCHRDVSMRAGSGLT